MNGVETRPSLALVLGGGAARGLAHIGVLELLESEGVRPAILAGSSMGGLISALWAAGLRASEIADLARGFHFPRWFVPGALVEWERIFRPAARILEPLSFEGLPTPLRITAVDLEQGIPVVLDSGRLLPAVRATCAVPGVIPPEKIGSRWLVDGGLFNLVPVDAAWSSDPDLVVAVSVSAQRARRMPQLNWKLTRLLSRFGRLLPNPATAKSSFEILVRAAEIALARTAVLSSAMAGPELLIEVDVEDIGLRDFNRLSDAVERGRTAAVRALPALRSLLESPTRVAASAQAAPSVDPVCLMAVAPRRARARAVYCGRTYLFCSENCRDAFLRAPDGYLRGVAS